MLGKYVGNLQEDVTISDRAIEGTLKYVTGYTGFSGDVSEQSGNYLVVHASVPDVNGVTITSQVEGSQRVVTLDSDGILILRVKSEDTLTKNLIFTASKTGCKSVTKMWLLNGLTLEEE